MGHATMENRHGLAVAGMITPANGTAERRASETMLNAKAKAARHRITVGEDRAYDAANHVANLCAIDHAAPRLHHAAIVLGDDRMHLRRKQHGTMRKTKHRGNRRIACAQSHIQRSKASHSIVYIARTRQARGREKWAQFPGFFRRLLGQTAPKL